MEAMPLRLDLCQVIWQKKMESGGHQKDMTLIEESIQKLETQHAKDSTVPVTELHSLYVQLHSLEKSGASATKDRRLGYRRRVDKLTQTALSNHMQQELSVVLKSTAVLANNSQKVQALPPWDIGLLRDYINSACSQKQNEPHILFRCCCSG